MSQNEYAPGRAAPKRRATGPRSDAGKQRAAQNARKHGLTSAPALDAGLAAQIASWRADPQLAGLAPELLVHLAECAARRARVRAYQMTLFGLGEAGEEAAPREAPETVRLALRYRAEVEAAYHKALRAVIAALHPPAKEEAT